MFLTTLIGEKPGSTLTNRMTSGSLFVFWPLDSKMILGDDLNSEIWLPKDCEKIFENTQTRIAVLI